MAAHTWKSGVGEMYRSWNKQAYTQAVQKLLPTLTEHDIHAAGSGVRAQAVDRTGKMLDDFHFVF
jgi:L-2-hydroxyglutarate oxidase